MHPPRTQTEATYEALRELDGVRLGDGAIVRWDAANEWVDVESPRISRELGLWTVRGFTDWYLRVLVRPGDEVNSESVATAIRHVCGEPYPRIAQDLSASRRAALSRPQTP
jgi:hypothetical protein